MKKLLLLILFILNLVLLQAQDVKFISVNDADTSLQDITFNKLPKLLEKDSLTADTLATPAKWMVKLQKKLSKEQRQDSNIYIFFCPTSKDSLKAFLPLSGKYGYVLFDTSKTGVVELEKVQERLSTHKYQWDLIHDPQTMLFAWAQDEEEGAMVSDYLALKIDELAKSLGLKLGENAFVTVHSFRCSNIGDLSGASPLDVSGYSNAEFTKFKPQRIIIANSENEDNADVVNIAILFRINDNEVVPEDKSSTGIVLPGMEPPFLGVLQKSGELVECPNQLSMLDEFGCVDDNSLVAKFAEENYKGLYMSKVLTAIHDCLEEQEIDNSEGKVGDLFYTEYLKGAESEEEINQLKQVADLFNRIGDVLFASNNATTWQEYGDFISASYDAHKQAEQEKPFSDYLSRLEGLISDYEHRKELLEKFEDREKVAILVNTFSDAELEFLPMKLRAHSLNVLSSKELRGALRLSGHNEEELTLRLLRFIKSEEISSLIDELKKGDLLNTIDKGFNDLFTLVDDNYAGLLDVIDDYVLQTKGITDGEAKTEKLVELHDQNRFYNLIDDQEGKKYISAAKVLSEGKVSITISTITGYDIVYVKQADGPLVPEIRPTIQSETIELPFDEPVALYHNAYLDGVDASKRGEIELASALKLHYYLQCNKSENIKTTASVIIDVGSLAVGVGAISGGIKGVRLVLAICDVASSTISLLSTGSEKYLIDKYGADGQAYVNSMQMISAVLGFVDLGATGVGKLKNLLKDDVVTAGAFYAKHGTELASDAKTTELATQTKKIVDEFTDYDDEIARLIDNAGSGVPELFWIRLTDGDKIKLQKFVDNGLDQEKLAAGYLDASNKVDFIEELDEAQSVFHQRALINDRVSEIPGVSNKPFVKNQLPRKIVTAPTTLNGAKITETGLDLPAIEAEKFISAELVELPENTVIYRVLGPNSYATGGYWTRTKPSNYAEIIGGTAVKPGWNGFTEIIEYKVPPGKKVYVWEGATAPQAVVDEGEPFYDLYKSKYSLEGGTDQIYMPEKYRDYKDPVISSEFNSRVSTPEKILWKK